jgi:glycosyltransferase involved in cell wall biosynthesis
MRHINLYLIDMAVGHNISGVDRYMGILLRQLERFPHVQVCWIHLLQDSDMLFSKEEEIGAYTKVTIPLPIQEQRIIGSEYWMSRYNAVVLRNIQHLLSGKENRILHLHTLNLIELALSIKQNFPCHIVTHLHCIPWKGLYNYDRRLFNQLYEMELKHTITDGKRLLTNFCEQKAYTEADHIICVTQCGSQLIQQLTDGKAKVDIISNGIDNYYTPSDDRKEEREHDVFQLLYVGALSESKGLSFILDALRKVQQRGYNVRLNIAAKPTMYAKRLLHENRDLDVCLLGLLPFPELCVYYSKSDAGVIASLQEQCSYAAIEMAMHGLPIITTAVDGLNEMFVDGENALKVRMRFSVRRSLEPDTMQMADYIIRLVSSPSLRKRLSQNGRKLFEQRFTATRMVEQTVQVYQNLLENQSR